MVTTSWAAALAIMKSESFILLLLILFRVFRTWRSNRWMVTFLYRVLEEELTGGVEALREGVTTPSRFFKVNLNTELERAGQKT